MLEYNTQHANEPLSLAAYTPRSDVNSYYLPHWVYSTAVKVKESHPGFQSQVKNIGAFD